jgi:exosortase
MGETLPEPRPPSRVRPAPRGRALSALRGGAGSRSLTRYSARPARVGDRDGAAPRKWIDCAAPDRAAAGRRSARAGDPATPESLRIDAVESDATQEDSPTGIGSGGAGGPAAATTLADLPAPGRRVLGLGLLNAFFAVVAFGPLVTFDPEPTLEKEFEGVFFTPSDTSPSIVLLLAAWLLYRRWDRLRRIPLRSGPAWLSGGLLLLAGAILAWATYVGARDLRVLALMAAVMGLGALFGGRRAMRALLLPAAFLALAMPMPAPLLNFTLLHMQFWTAEFAGLLLHLIGTTAFVAGDQVLLEDNSFAIIETCSGVRITETLTMLTILMLDLFRRRPLHSAILLVLTPLVAFLCNGVRAVTLILNPHADIAEIHTLQGIGMLLGGLIVLYAIDGLLGWLLHSKAPTGAPPPDPPPAAAAGRPVGAWSLWVATGALAAFAALALLVPPWSPPPRRPSPDLARDFAEIGEWSSHELRVDHKFLGRIWMQRDLSRRYYRSGQAVDLYAAVGARSFRPRSALFTKAALPGSGWNTQEQGAIRLEPGGIDATWRVSVSETRKFLVISWHERAGGLLGESLRSFLGLDRSPLRQPGQPVVARIATRMTGLEGRNRAQAEARLLQFYAVLRPKLDALNGILEGDTP